MTSKPPPAMSTASNSQSYRQLVWQQFCQNYLALFGLGLAALFMLLALLAPILAGRLPFYWQPTGETTCSFPWFREFFAPMDGKERLLERAFNFALLLIPVILLLRKCFPRRFKLLSVVFALLLSLPFIFTQARNQPADYWLLAQNGQGSGIFPLLPYGAYQQIFPPKIPPTWHQPSEANQRGYSFLGSDENGRDVLVRLLYGARVSLAVGFVSVGFATLIGIVIGALTGYFGGWPDMLISRAIEILMCFPMFFLILTIIAFLEHRSILNIMLVIGLTGWTGTARLVRGEVLAQRQRDYVEGARALGAGTGRIIFYHLLPNSLAPVLVSASFGIAGAILVESGLSFLGLGVSMPTATWGEMLSEGRASPLVNWWLTLFPGILIFLSMTAYNLVGEGMRDALDPKLRPATR